MDFDLSAEQRLLEESIDSFFAGSFPLSRVRDCYDTRLGPLDDLGALHLSEILIPEAYGGGGGTILDVAVAAERLGAAAAPGPFLGRVLASYAITVAGSEEQRARWLPKLASGERRATIAVSDDLDHVRVSIHAARPGVVLGHGGAEMERLRTELQELTGKPVRLNMMTYDGPPKGRKEVKMGPELPAD